jgi:hypothetical protein
MFRWKTVLSVLCLAMWLPATQHCKLEQLPGLGFLQCAGESADESDCASDSCQTVEHGAYKTPDNQTIFSVLLNAFSVMPLWELPLIPNQKPLPLIASRQTFKSPPTDSWESYSARALGIRGPSIS